MVNNHGDRKSPRPGVVGPLPNGRTSWLINRGDPNYLRPSWDDLPSMLMTRPKDPRCPRMYTPEN